jgi:hypothetical protein
MIIRVSLHQLSMQRMIEMPIYFDEYHQKSQYIDSIIRCASRDKTTILAVSAAIC